jgi:MYXO-CTERM domain-containing protein
VRPPIVVLVAELVLAVVASEASAQDAGMDAGASVVGPDGSVGICCPAQVRWHDFCDGVDVGGWAATADECRFRTYHDCYLFSRSTDEWGCEIEVPRCELGCCNCTVDAGHDAGLDGGASPPDHEAGCDCSVARASSPAPWLGVVAGLVMAAMIRGPRARTLR